MSWGERINNFTAWVKHGHTRISFSESTLTFGRSDVLINHGEAERSRAEAGGDSQHIQRASAPQTGVMARFDAHTVLGPN